MAPHLLSENHLTDRHLADTMSAWHCYGLQFGQEIFGQHCSWSGPLLVKISWLQCGYSADRMSVDQLVFDWQSRSQTNRYWIEIRPYLYCSEEDIFFLLFLCLVFVVVLVFNQRLSKVCFSVQKKWINVWIERLKQSNLAVMARSYSTLCFAKTGYVLCAIA